MGSESHNNETIWSESHNAETIWTDVQSDESSCSSSSACSVSSHDSAIRPTISGDSADSASKKRWVKELRQNIFDISIFLDQEECPEAQRTVLQRAIDSQKQTLISLRSIDEKQYATIRFGSRNGGDGTVSNRKNVDHRANNAFLNVPLEAIIDTSEDFRHLDSTQKM